LHSHSDTSAVLFCAQAPVRVAVAAQAAHSAQVRPSPWCSAAHTHTDTSRLVLNGHACSWTPPVAAHPWHGEQEKPVPKYPALHAQEMVSTRVCRSQTPYVVACASQLVHCPQVWALVVITPA
jgi:hypothetical protein